MPLIVLINFYFDISKTPLDGVCPNPTFGATMETNQLAFGSSDTHFVADPSGALYCRAGNFSAAYDTTATLAVLPAFGTFAGGLNLRGAAAFEPLSDGADGGAHVLSQAEISAVVNERCLPD